MLFYWSDRIFKCKKIIKYIFYCRDIFFFSFPTSFFSWLECSPLTLTRIFLFLAKENAMATVLTWYKLIQHVAVLYNKHFNKFCWIQTFPCSRRYRLKKLCQLALMECDFRALLNYMYVSAFVLIFNQKKNYTKFNGLCFTLKTFYILLSVREFL